MQQLLGSVPDWIQALGVICAGAWTLFLFRRTRASGVRTTDQNNGKQTITVANTDDRSSNNAATAKQYAINASDGGSHSNGSRLVFRWTGNHSFELRNSQPTPLQLEYVRNRDQFVLLDLDMPVTVPPFGAVTGTASGAWGAPTPGVLVLDVVGEDAPLPVEIPTRTS